MPFQTIEPLFRAGPACQNEFGIIISPIHLFVDKGPRPILKALELIGVFKKPLQIPALVLSCQFQAATRVLKSEDAKTPSKSSRSCLVQPNPENFHDVDTSETDSVNGRMSLSRSRYPS
jgi:hypothetical protein